MRFFNLYTQFDTEYKFYQIIQIGLKICTYDLYFLTCIWYLNVVILLRIFVLIIAQQF